jgi:hypothetical protein
MDPYIRQTTQDASGSFPLEGNIDAIELTDQDLEKVIGGMGGFGFRPFHRSPFGFNSFNSSTAIAINTVAIAIA